MGVSERTESGAAAVEFALIVPLLVLMLCAIIDFGSRYQYASTVNSAAMVAARDMSITNDVVHAKTAGMDAGAPATSWDAIAPCTSGGNVSVTIRYTKATVTRAFGANFSGVAKAVARCQM